MGVHDVNRYGEVRSALGIPEGEPLFIIRAQDRMSPEILAHYRRAYTQAAMIEQTPLEVIDRFVADMDKAVADFIDWQQKNSDVVKFPD